MLKKSRKILSVLLILSIILPILPAKTSWAIIPGADIGSPGVTFEDQDRKSYVLKDYWDVIDSASGSRIGVTAALANKRGGGENWYNLIDYTKLTQWVTAFRGNIDFVEDELASKKYELTRLEDDKGFIRYWIRDIIRACGGEIGDYSGKEKECEAIISNPPLAKITPQVGSIIAGKETDISISARSWVLYRQVYKGLEWVFKINGRTIDSGQTSQCGVDETISYTFPQAGDYTLTLIAVDGVQREATQEIEITVQSGSTPPEEEEPDPYGPAADFNAPRFLETGESATLINTSTSGDAAIIGSSWSVSPSATLNEGSGTLSNATFRASSPGEYAVTLKVMDDNGKRNSATKYIRVEEPELPPPPPNEEPRARLVMPSYCHAGDTVTVTNLSTDDDGIVYVDWDISPLDGVEASLNDNGGTITFNEVGRYEVKLTVGDTDGATDYDVDAISVRNEPPSAKFDMPSSCHSRDTVTVANLSSDDDGIVDVRWDISPLNGVESSLSDDGGTITFNEVGNYEVRLTIEDTNGATDSYVDDIDVENKPPKAIFSMPSSCHIGDTIEVKNESYDDREITSTTWEVNPSENIEAFLDNTGGTITFTKAGEYEVTLTCKDADGAIGSKTNIIEVRNEPPVARINLPDTILQGQDFVIKNMSYDPDDDEIVNATWEIEPPDYLIGDLSQKENTVYFDKEGVYTITLTVEEEWGLTGTTSKEIVVEPAIPTAYFDYDGTPKQNRKVVFDASQSLSFDRYPIIWEETVWTFIPPSGVSTDNVKLVDLGDQSRREVLFKEPGKYTITLTVTNEAGHTSEPYTLDFKIYPDEPPVVDFALVSSVLRDPENKDANGEALARIDLTDNTMSPDGDIISKRIWKYRFDSNNDGNFDDETWVVLDDGNNIAPTLYTNHVGKYQFELYAEESFREATIPEFITEADKRTGNTENKTLSDKVCNVINSAPLVNFGVTTEPKVDIVFTVGEASSDKTKDLPGDIAQYIETELRANNIDAQITSVDTSVLSSNDANAATIFNEWVNFPDGLGSWYLDPNNGIISSDINPWYETGFYDPEGFGTKNFEMEADIKATQPIQPMGFIFRVHQKENGKYQLYFLWISSNSQFFNESVVAIFKVDDYYFNTRCSGTPLATLGKNSLGESTMFGWINHEPHDYGGFPHETPMQKGLTVSNVWDPTIKSTIVDFKRIPYLNTSKWYELKLVVNEGNIEVYFDDSRIINCVDSNPIEKGTYGLFQYSHVQPYFKNVRIATRSIKTFDKVLKEPNWRDNSTHFVANISDVLMPEFNDPDKSAVIQSQLLNNGIYFSGFGTSANQAQYQSIIQSNLGRGSYYSNINMDAALQDYADYILSTVNSSQSYSQYVLLGETVKYDTTYIDSESDSPIEERWKYDHEPYYFENSLGQISSHDKWVSGPITVFDKTGEFSVVFEKRDNPVGSKDEFDNYRLWSDMPTNDLTLYAHRKPIANFIVNPKATQATDVITDLSYDLDHSSEVNKGIVEWDWRWKEADSASWHSGKITLSDFEQGKNYLVYLRVKDKEGVWSDPAAQFVTTKEANLPPVALFLVSPNQVPVGIDLTVTDNSFDPNGDSIAEREWTVVKDGVTKYKGSSFPTKLGSNYGVGTYQITLKVRDNPQTGSPLWSEPYSQFVTVIPRNNPPIIETLGFSPDPIISDEPYNCNVEVSDLDGDPIELYEWTITKPDGTKITRSQLAPTFEEMGLDEDGEYIIQLRVRDNPLARNPYLEKLWSETRVVTVTVEGKLEIIGDSNRNEYKAGEAIILYADTEGKAYKVEAKMWYNGNEFTGENTTELVAGEVLSNPPQDLMSWHTRHEKGDRDIVVIIPKNMPDGVYEIQFTAYKKLLSGGEKTATDTITIRVNGMIYDHSGSQIIG